MKLGKRNPLQKESLKFGSFLTKMPEYPLVDTPPSFVYPMDGNDTVGDCVVAGFDHARQTITGLLTGTQQNFTQQEIWDFYKTQNPEFDPSTDKDDNGMDVQTFLEYLVANKYILAFASIDYMNEAEFRAAMYLGLGILTGVQLRNIQMQQFAKGKWSYVPKSPIDGGHCIPFIGYGKSQATCVTWGKEIPCTDSFIKHQMDEAWFILMQEHVDHPEFRNHFDLPAFSEAVSEITGGKVVIH